MNLMKKKLVVLGGGGHAKVLISVIKKLNDFAIVGYTDPKSKKDILGIKWLGEDSILSSIKSEGIANYAAIGIGKTEKKDCRKELLSLLLKCGFELPVVISSNAVINEDVKIGDATHIFDGVVVNSGSSIGKAVILNTNVTVEHDCRIGSFSHIAPGSTICGGVEIGEGSFIGAGSTITPCCKIAENCIIGAGSVVISNCYPGVYVGCPAKKIK